MERDDSATLGECASSQTLLNPSLRRLAVRTHWWKNLDAHSLVGRSLHSFGWFIADLVHEVQRYLLWSPVTPGVVSSLSNLFPRMFSLPGELRNAEWRECRHVLDARSSRLISRRGWRLTAFVLTQSDQFWTTGDVRK